VKPIAATSAGKPFTTLQLCQEIQSRLRPEAPEGRPTDFRIVQILKERGFVVSRPTVAEYHALCGIPCVNDRRRSRSRGLFPARM
jgi:DNA-directed RNA polymerase specialized sigma54-like protein